MLFRSRVDSSGALLWIAADPVAATLSLVARDAVDLVTSPAIERVRECADPTCGALFVDNSRPGKRRWCSMGACGNRAKKSTIRSKAAQSREQGNGKGEEKDRGRERDKDKDRGADRPV